MFDARHIRTFDEVVRTGSFSGAARVLGYTQPAITQQMKALERDVGTPLFIRVGRRIRLTEAGEALSRHAGTILETIATAQHQMSALTRLRSGRVRVCAFPSAGATIVPEALSSLAAGHPGVRVELQESEPPESLERVARGVSDLSLAFTYPGLHEQVPDELVEVKLLEDQLTVVMPARHPMAGRRAVRLAELAEERWIAGCLRCRANFLHECAELGFAPDIAFTTDDILVVQSLVAEGLGIAMMPGLVLSCLSDARVAGRSLDPASRRQVSAYVLREHLRIPATALVLDALKEAAARRVGC
jgi:DNA-binding transcriptional LysR family regulator